jgi:hypothetical protein
MVRAKAKDGSKNAIGLGNFLTVHSSKRSYRIDSRVNFRSKSHRDDLRW